MSNRCRFQRIRKFPGAPGCLLVAALWLLAPGPLSAQPPARRVEQFSATVAPLVSQARSKTPKARAQAMKAIAALGNEAAEALPVVCAATTDGEEQVRQAAFEALEQIAPKLYDPLRLLVLEQEMDRRMAGVADLAALGEEAKPVVPVFAQSIPNMLKPTSEDDRGLSARVRLAVEMFRAAAVIAPDHPEVIKLSRQLIVRQNKSAQLRQMAFDSLFAHVSQDKGGRKESFQLLRDALDDEVLREQAFTSIIAMGSVGKDSKELVELLKKLKISPNEAIRSRAGAALAAIDGTDKAQAGVGSPGDPKDPAMQARTKPAAGDDPFDESLLGPLK